MNSIKVCEYSRSRSFHDDLILQDQASGERSQDHWSSGITLGPWSRDAAHMRPTQLQMYVILWNFGQPYIY